MRAITPLLLLMTAILGSAAAPDASRPLSLHGWKLLAPLPDPVGFGGMFAGVLNGRLVAGGGSQFPTKPVWLQGEKIFSDRIFVLADVAGQWTEQATKLPFKAGHYASAYTADAIYVAGGLDAGGCTRQAWEIRAKGEGFAFKQLPDLPQTLGYGAAAVVAGRLYVVGGQNVLTVRVASAEVWSLDLQDKSAWRREPDLPDAGVFLAAAAGQGHHLYVFGGVNLDAAGKAIQSARAYRLDLTAGKWERLPDLPEPRVAAATPAVPVGEQQFFLIGGYARSFPGAPREHPGFDAGTFVYDLAEAHWLAGPSLPKAPVADRDAPGDQGPAPMVAAPGVLWRNHAVVISGEVRASTRSPAVLAWPLEVPPGR
jgi:hypothetical protein